MKTLKHYLEVLKNHGLVISYCLYGKGDTKVEHMTYVSAKAERNSMFICKGAGFKAEYLKEAVQRGAFCYVSEEFYGTDADVPYIMVQNIRKSMSILAQEFYGNPDRNLNLIGITGTKGKTTTTYYIREILNAYLNAKKEPNAAFLSTIETYDGKEQKESELTTPEAPELFRHFRNAVDSGIKYLAMEVSSQALKYQRVRNISYDIGVFLNISEDHISPAEHEDFEDYFSAKLSLFRQVKVACVNTDADHSERILNAAKMTERVVTFGLKGSPEVRGCNVKTTQNGITFTVSCPAFSETFSLGMKGIFNVENALAAIAVAYTLKIPTEYIKEGLKQTKVPGRMEIFNSEDGEVSVIVDYAHNRLSFEKLYDSVLREYRGWRIVSVFGCPGNKAMNRRRDLGLLSGLFSKKVYLTADDPGTESVVEIAGEVGKYIEVVGCPYEIIEDRGEAIRKAIAEAGRNTVILVLGKGCETKQKYGRITYCYPKDAEYVKQGMQEYNSKIEARNQRMRKFSA